MTMIHGLPAQEKPFCPLHPDLTPEHIWTKDDFQYLCCPQCRLMWVNPQLTDEAVSQIYAAGFKSKSGKTPVYPGKRNFREGLGFISPNKVNGGQLLDVGTFTGHFLVAAREDGWQTVEGTEISEGAIQFAKENYDITVHQGDLLSIDLPEAHYDAITLSDVIEHVSDPLATIERIHDLLRVGGILYMHTPHFNSLPRYYYGKDWNVFFPWHRTIFSVPAMRQMLERGGFTVKVIRTVGVMPLGTDSAWARYLKNLERDEQVDNDPSPEQPITASPSWKRQFRNIFRPLWLGYKRSLELPFIPLSAMGIHVGSRLVVCAAKK